MSRYKPNLAMRFSPADKSSLREVSRRMNCSQTEAVRVLVRERLAILKDKTKPVTHGVSRGGAPN